MDAPEDVGFDDDDKNYNEQNQNSKNNINQDSLVEMER